jgi:putative transposase
MQKNEWARTRKPYVPPKNQRLDAELYATAGSVGYFTVCAYRRSSPFTAPELNDAVIAVLLQECQRMDMDLYAYCLMPDHLHILIGPRKDGSSMLAFVDQFKGKSTRESWSHGWQGKLWQRRSYDHLVRRTEDLQPVAQYVLDNPVRRGVVDRRDDYPWAGLVDPLPW